ncbi:MAG: FGGY-family carbohydrate kinase [Eubacteriales bacterium]|nr:FGGY-family carbohydrate kinase [Eubacteriales bacterium]
MREKKLVIAYDIGTTGNKTCLYEVGGGMRLIAQAPAKYPLYLTEDGFAEQDPNDWWDTLAATTRQVLHDAGVPNTDIAAVSFCSQMQCVILVDETGKPLRRAMSYMDKRATEEFARFGKGLIQIAGVGLRKLIISLAETGVVAASAKDPVFRYNWVKNHEPELFKRVYKWLDAKDYLLFRATGRYTMAEDSAFGTLLYSCKRKDWSRKVCDLHGVNRAHLPELIRSTDMVGMLTPEAAAFLGLTTNCKVFAGGGDSSLIGVGAGSTRVGDTHMYIGTSGWVSTVVDRQMADLGAMIASIAGVNEGRYNYFAEMETSGKCIEWLRDNIVLDGVGAYESSTEPAGSMIERVLKIAESAPAGAGGVLFVPWLLGNRCPFEDAFCRAGFFNVSINTTKAELCRAVIEGILYHKRWMLEAQAKKIKTSEVIRLAGGGARSAMIAQTLADMLGRPVEVPESPENAGAAGAAVIMAAGLGCIGSLDEANSEVQIRARYTPDPAKKPVYDKGFLVFQRLYRKNRKNYALLNR